MKPEHVQRLTAQRAALLAQIAATPEPEREPLQRMVDTVERMLVKSKPHRPRPELEGVRPITSVPVGTARELRIGVRDVEGVTEVRVDQYRRHPKSGQMERTRNGMRLEPTMLPGLVDALRLAQQHLPAKAKP